MASGRNEMNIFEKFGQVFGQDMVPVKAKIRFLDPEAGLKVKVDIKKHKKRSWEFWKRTKKKKKQEQIPDNYDSPYEVLPVQRPERPNEQYTDPNGSRPDSSVENPVDDTSEISKSNVFYANIDHSNHQSRTQEERNDTESRSDPPSMKLDDSRWHQDTGGATDGQDDIILAQSRLSTERATTRKSRMPCLVAPSSCSEDRENNLHLWNIEGSGSKQDPIKEANGFENVEVCPGPVQTESCPSFRSNSSKGCSSKQDLDDEANSYEHVEDCPCPAETESCPSLGSNGSKGSRSTQDLNDDASGYKDIFVRPGPAQTETCPSLESNSSKESDKDSFDIEFDEIYQRLRRQSSIRDGHASMYANVLENTRMRHCRIEMLVDAH